MYLNANTLKDMRQMVEQFMPDTVGIYNISTTTDEFGIETKVRTLALTTKGQLTAPSGNEREILSALANEGTENREVIKLVLPFGTDINVNQEVTTADGKDWNVAFVNSSETFTAATFALLERQVVV